MRGKELSCEGVLLCASMKEIRYKLVSMDGKYKHTHKNCWECFHILLFNLFHSYEKKGIIPFKWMYKYLLNTNQYLSIGLVLIKHYTAFWMTINNLETLNKNKISDILRRSIVEKKKGTGKIISESYTPVEKKQKYNFIIQQSTVDRSRVESWSNH